MSNAGRRLIAICLKTLLLFGFRRAENLLRQRRLATCKARALFQLFRNYARTNGGFDAGDSTDGGVSAPKRRFCYRFAVYGDGLCIAFVLARLRFWRFLCRRDALRPLLSRAAMPISGSMSTLRPKIRRFSSTAPPSETVCAHTKFRSKYSPEPDASRLSATDIIRSGQLSNIYSRAKLIRLKQR